VPFFGLPARSIGFLGFLVDGFVFLTASWMDFVNFFAGTAFTIARSFGFGASAANFLQINPQSPPQSLHFGLSIWHN
jgi:fucose permease